MKIEVLILPKELLRYNQLDDYLEVDGALILSIADTGNELYNKLLLVHCIVEEMLTKAKGIKEEDISKYDSEHVLSEEPGLEKDSPYRHEHLVAEGIERILCGYLGINWKDYEEALE